MNNVLVMLAQLILAQKRQQEEDTLLRDIVADGRRSSPATLPMDPFAKVGIANAPVVVTGGPGPKHSFGWSDAVPLSDWKPPGDRYIDAMLKADDAQWRAKRQRGEL